MSPRLILFIILLSPSVWAQQLNFSNFGTDKGLPSSEVFSVLQDSRGYMWFTTNNGVCRYNGKAFTTYTTAQGLTDNTVFTMCEDRKGRIWFGPQNNEICYWQNDSIYRIPGEKALRNALPSASAVIQVIYADTNDNIWIYTNNGLYTYESSTNYTEIKLIKQSENYNLEIRILDGKAGLALGPILSATDGNTVAAHTITVAYNAKNSIKKVHFPDLLSPRQNLITSIVLTKTGAILFSSRNKIYCISADGKTGSMEFDKQITRISLDRDEGLWVGFIKGGVQYYKNADIYSVPEKFLEKYSVTKVCKDNEGGVWVTTLERGVFYTPSIAVRIYPDITALEDHIIGMASLQDKIIIHTYGNFIAEASGDQQIKPSLEFSKLSDKFGRLNMLCMIQDTLYASFEKELLVLDGKLNRIKNNVGVNGFATNSKGILQTE